MEELARDLLGVEAKPEDLIWWQAALRAVVMYLSVLVIVRLGKKRALGRGTAFDVVVGIVIGSIAGRAMTGNAPIATASAAIATTVALHWLFSWIALRSHGFGKLVKGDPVLVIRNGEVDERALRAAHLTRYDLEEDLRGEGRDSTEGIREGRIERNGDLSVLSDEKPPRVVDVSVEPGVKTVRIELG
jgi:uncharacterized membrane protein YcaP (DUF421 family)